MYSIYFYHIYETGSAINLNDLEKSLSQNHNIARSRFHRLKPKSIHMEVAPLNIILGGFKVLVAQRELTLTARAKLFDIGAISICLVLEEESNDLSDMAFHFAGQVPLEQAFLDYLAMVRGILEPELGDLHLEPEFYEDYTIYLVQHPHQVEDPVAVLLGEPGPFSEQIREQLMRNTLSYSPDDYAILSWDSALLCDRETPADLIELIEFANVQLMELCYYDRLLSEQMTKMYDDIDKAYQLSIFGRSRRYHFIMTQLMELIADITEVTEKIGNLIKITEDIYYARVYENCLKVLRVQSWTESVNRKTNVIQQNYTMLSNEVNIQNSNVLEWIIIILIAMEFALAIWESII